jgi:hypothetical protein
MNFQIVVARYNENINYLIPLSNIVIIYNKGNDNIPLEFKNVINLPNIGREAHTYLYHIINNYNNLSENTMFIQANIKDHKLLDFKEYLKNNTFTGKLSRNNINILKSYIHHDGKYLKDLKQGLLKKVNITPFNFINDNLGIDIKYLNYVNIVWGANFCVNKKLIQNKNIDFYKSIIKYVEYHSNPEEGHFFERSWYLIFNHPNYKFKKTILYYYIDKKYLNNYNFNKILNITNSLSSNIEEIHIWSSLNNLNNYKDKILIKYLNNFNYINIYPFISDNSFEFKFTDSTFLLLEFRDDKYELRFENNNIQIYHYNSDINIITIYYKKIRIKKPFLIKWTEYDLMIDDLVIIPILLYDINDIRISVKGYNSFIEYSNNNQVYKFSYFYTVENNIIDNFYLNNYNDYYTFNLLNY